MDNYLKNIDVLEKKIIILLNKLKENHLKINKLSARLAEYQISDQTLKNKLSKIEDENNSLKIANNLLGSSDSKTHSKRKINKIIGEIDRCIFNLSEINTK